MKTVSHQVKALLLKNVYLMKRQKLSYCVMIVSPLVCLLLLYLIDHLIRTYNTSNMKRLDTAGIMPTMFYAMNMMNNQQMGGALKVMYQTNNSDIVHRYAVVSEDIKPQIEDMVSSCPLSFYFETNGTRQPRFINIDIKNEEEANLKLEEDLYHLHTVSRQDAMTDKTLPDSFTLFKSFNQSSGISAHIQVNNLVYIPYHRQNGFNSFLMKSVMGDEGIDKLNSSIDAIVPSEGYMSLMNLYNNQFIQKRLDSPGVSSKDNRSG